MFLLSGCGTNNGSASNISEDKSINLKEESSHKTNYVYVKYRDDLVDIAHPRWEYLNTSKSSWVRGAWYDDNNQYMIIDLDGIKYHYCGMSASIWESFKSANSFGTFYNIYLKGSYDCRNYSVPEYNE